MPIYVYEPTLHSLDDPVSECCFFETLQSLSEHALSDCPHCGHKVHRCLTTFGVSVVSQKKESPRSSAAIRLREGFQALSKVDESAEGKSFDQTLQDAFSQNLPPTTQGGRAARLAARHLCSNFCKH